MIAILINLSSHQSAQLPDVCSLRLDTRVREARAVWARGLDPARSLSHDERSFVRLHVFARCARARCIHLI